MKLNSIKAILGALALTGLALATTAAQAGGRHPEHDHPDAGSLHCQQSRHVRQQVNARQNHQMARILAGKRSGRLTRMEFRELIHEQRNIQAMERYFLADGCIDAREFHRLDQALDRASRNIHEERHDRQVRYASGQAPRINYWSGQIYPRVRSC